MSENSSKAFGITSLLLGAVGLFFTITLWYFRFNFWSN